MTEVLERGDIGFFFRPAVQPADAVETRLGVQSFFVVLSTASGVHRRVRIGRKRMPAPTGERFWARVERVGSLQRVLGDQLEAEQYTTKTRGERYQPGARHIAQGCYAFVRHDDHMHLVYRVEQVEQDAPEEVRVPDAMSLLVLFERGPRGPRGRAIWSTEGGPPLLDDEGFELVLVGVHDEPERELGIDVLGHPMDHPI
ncbi:MAG TPA: hypothetical protein VFV99_06365 [Kofleriaceae bacterium]|nr:hypothetical protein [Kofleriaceae bacterium]